MAKHMVLTYLHQFGSWNDHWLVYGIYANMNGFFVDGIHGTPYIAYMDPMGNVS